MANDIAGSVNIPLLTVNGVIKIGVFGTIFASISKCAVSAIAGGGQGSFSLPLMKLSSIATTNNIITFSGRIPRITISASAYSEQNGSLVGSIPILRITCVGDMGHNGSVEKKLPYIALTSSAINGLISGLSKSIPSVKLTSSAYWMVGATIDISIPYLRLNARAENSDILAILMNTKNFGLTEYVNYDYNSLGFFNGKMVGAKSTGIYELAGDDDDGENIEWSFKTGKLDMDDTQVKKARHVWLSYNPSGDLILVVDDGENEYEYEVESVKQIDNAVRVKLGKGIRNRFLQFELKNVANEKINLDRMRIFAEPIGKKR